MKIICCADLHLGRVSSVPNNIDNRSYSAFETWKKIIRACNDENADLLLVAGDVFDKDSNPFLSFNYLENGLRELNNTQTVMIPGNHDLKHLEGMINTLNNENIHFIGKDCTWEKYEYKGLNIFGFGFDREIFEENPFKTYSVNNIQGENYILMVHGDYKSSKGNYAPFGDKLKCAQIKKSVITLIGHTHKREETEYYTSLGSPQAFDFGEKGQHGYYILELDENLKKKSFEFRSVSSVYYDMAEIDVSLMDQGQELLNILLDNLKAVSSLNYYRIVFKGRLSEEKFAKFNEDFENLSVMPKIGDNIFIDFNNCKNSVLRMYDLNEVARQNNAAGLVAKMILSVDRGDFKEEYKAEYSDMKSKISEYMKDFKNYIEVTDEDILENIRENLVRILNEKKGEY